MKNKEMKLGLEETEQTELDDAKSNETQIEILDDSVTNEEVDKLEKRQNTLIWLTNMSLNIALNQTYIGQQAIAAFINVK